jgi:SAM-dependent methyltransferase
MHAQIHTSGFVDVDRAQQPESLVSYLDTLGALAPTQAYKREVLALLDLHDGDRVLDAGCGTGEDVQALAAIVGPSGRAVGVDRSARMIAEARRRCGDAGPQLRFLAGDVRRLRFPDAAFDACRADRVLQHLGDPRAALAEMARVVRPGGRVVISEPDWGALLIDAPDQSVTQQVLEVRRKRIAQPFIGRRLPALFRGLELSDVAVVAHTAILGRYEQAEELFGLQETAAQAREEGLITAGEAEDWLAALAAAGLAGSFFVAFTIFTVKGCKGK